MTIGLICSCGDAARTNGDAAQATGLTVARSMARRLGGDITLDTSYSNGARFIMTLPLDGKEEQSGQ